MLPNQPLFIPFFTVRSSTVSSSPSSIPVTRAKSLLRSYALSLSIMLVGMFFMAALASSKKNSLPSTRILFTFLPLMVTPPFSSTCAPGSFFTRSSSTEPSGTRYASALYTMESPLTCTFATLAVTVTSFISLASGVMCR